MICPACKGTFIATSNQKKFCSRKECRASRQKEWDRKYREKKKKK
jgi:hypothetical protein